LHLGKQALWSGSRLVAVEVRELRLLDSGDSPGDIGEVETVGGLGGALLPGDPGHLLFLSDSLLLLRCHLDTELLVRHVVDSSVVALVSLLLRGDLSQHDWFLSEARS